MKCSIRRCAFAACAASLLACANGDDGSVLDLPDTHVATDSSHADIAFDVPPVDSTTDAGIDTSSATDSHVDDTHGSDSHASDSGSSIDSKIDDTGVSIDSEIDSGVGVDTSVDVVSVDAPTPIVGDVVISEILIDAPTVGTTSEVGEYVEIFNASTHAVNLAGCLLRSKSGTSTESTAAFGDVPIAPLEYVVLLKLTAGQTYDFTAAATYGTIAFSNSSADYVALQCAAGDVDGIGWNGDTDFPDVTATKPPVDTSRERSTASLALGKDTSTTTWCDGVTSHTITNATGTGTFMGSPTAANGCP
jgi:hypothetical protein